MENVRFSNVYQIIDCCRESVRLGFGKEGECYRVQNKTYKFYNSNYRQIYNNEFGIENLLKFRQIIIDNFYFIRSLIYYNDMVIGSVCDYAKGMSCGKISLHRRNLDSLIIALNTLKKNVYELSKLGIYIKEDFLPNILYDGVVFRMIDTAEYFFSSKGIFSDDDIEVIYKENMRLLIGALFERITDVDVICDKFISSFLNEINSPYKEYLVDIDMMINPDDTIMGIRNTIQGYIDREIVSFSNCRSDLRRILKK